MIQGGHIHSWFVWGKHWQSHSYYCSHSQAYLQQIFCGYCNHTHMTLGSHNHDPFVLHGQKQTHKQAELPQISFHSTHFHSHTRWTLHDHNLQWHSDLNTEEQLISFHSKHCHIHIHLILHDHNLQWHSDLNIGEQLISFHSKHCHIHIHLILHDHNLQWHSDPHIQDQQISCGNLHSHILELPGDFRGNS